jgi:hypothetical protein
MTVFNKAFKSHFKSFMAFKWLLNGFSAASKPMIERVLEV